MRLEELWSIRPYIKLARKEGELIYDTDQTLPSSSMPPSDFSVDDHLSSAASSYESDDEYQLAQREWEESLGQLQQLVATVLLPFFGKWLGRRWSHIGSISSAS